MTETQIAQHYHNRSLCAISLEERLKIATHPLSYFNTILKFSMMLILTLN